MLVKRFALGVRFDLLWVKPDEDMARNIFEEIFSVLTASDMKNVMLYGGEDPTAEEGESIYLVVMMGIGLSQTRKLFRKLDNDAGISMYLPNKDPYIQSNRVSRIEGLTYFGTVTASGAIIGGERDCFGLSVPKKHGKKRPAGKGIKILLAPDSFKGTLSSTEAIKRLTFAARRHFPGVKIVPVPMADGGEGTVRALVTAGNGEYRYAKVTAPDGKRRDAVYGVINGKTAIIEMAEASGLTLVPQDERCIMTASSQGTGELIRRALDEGIRDIVIGLGGSATNDCGMGCARALGVRFFDADDAELTGCGGNLAKVARVDIETLLPAVRSARFTVMCDVSNPLLGPIGATYVYGPQKSGTKEQLDELEAGMANFIDKLESAFSVSVRDVPGAGAAGGMGAMLMAALGAELKPGIDALLDAVDFNRLLKGVALAVTGEGCIDEQSTSYGKTISGIVKRCAKRRVPVAILAGTMKDGAQAIYDVGSSAIMTCISHAMTTEESCENAVVLFDDAADRMFRFIRMGRDVEKIGAPRKKRDLPFPGIRAAIHNSALQRQLEKHRI